MHAKVEAHHRLTLTVLRLVDADLLLPEEGSALLAEVATFEHTHEEADATEMASRCKRLLPQLEALAQSDGPGTLNGQEAKIIVRRILNEADDAVRP